MDFWAGVALGFFFNLVASQCWDFVGRYRAYKSARVLVGTWEAFNIQGRTVDTTPMKGAGLTVVSRRRGWWKVNSAVLDVRSCDIDPTTGKTREHDGHIVIDPAIPWKATRIDRYADSGEISQQTLVMNKDPDLIHVFPVPMIATLGNVYAPHAWRRKTSPAS